MMKEYLDWTYKFLKNIHLKNLQYVKFSIQYQIYKILYLQVKFVTKLYHPNVTSEGCIEIDILQHNNWSPAYTIARSNASSTQYDLIPMGVNILVQLIKYWL